VYVAEGVGRQAPTAPTFTGPQTLRIEPSAIPDALEAFTDAYERVAKKVKELQHLPIREWAGDPVSSETRTQFAERSNTGGTDSAIKCLEGYQAQLARAVASLRQSQAQYLLTEGDNAALWGKYDQV